MVSATRLLRGHRYTSSAAAAVATASIMARRASSMMAATSAVSIRSKSGSVSQMAGVAAAVSSSRAASSSATEPPVGPERWQTSMVTGASRGIGLEMVRQLLVRGNPNAQVVAACRRPAEAETLSEMARNSGGRLRIVEMDVTSEDSVRRAAEEVASVHSRIDLVVNTVGLLHASNGASMPETALNKVDPENALLSYKTNALGPLLVAKHFTELLSNRARDMSDGTGLFASISARVGSISDNSLGGWYSYRASKAALNMLMTNVALENVRRRRPFGCVLLHPGTVDTDLSKPFQVRYNIYIYIFLQKYKHDYCMNVCVCVCERVHICIHARISLTSAREY